MVVDFSFVAFLSMAVGFAALGVAILIAHMQGLQNTRIEKLIEDTGKMTGEIHDISLEQQETKSRLQTEFARDILFLINLARSRIHGMNVQIKFLKLEETTDEKLRTLPSFKILGRERREEIFENNMDGLRQTMSLSKIDPKTILKLFDESTMLSYEHMWKMFVYANTLLEPSRKYYESMMEQMIELGIVNSEELHKIFIQHIPESQKKGYALVNVVPKNQ